MAAPTSKTMFNYFTKLPSKAVVVEESNPRKLAPVFNKQHVEEFQSTRLEQFDAELFNINNNRDQSAVKESNGSPVVENGHSTNGFGNRKANGTSDHKSEDVPMDVSLTSNVTYIDSVKSGLHKPFKLDRKPRGPLRARFLQYHEDVRPPYFGTWRKRSKKITGRRPFALDEDMFDYEVDSEAEWDIGGPGESLKGDDSDDDEEVDDYEIDMKTFVPHGYVSDDEVEVQSDKEDSNASIMIVYEKKTKSDQQEPQQAQPQQQHQQRHQTANKQPQPITLGIHYEVDEPTLKAFQGVSCK